MFGHLSCCTTRDWYTDGCVSMLSINDPSAEPSGFIFDGTGKTAFYHLQHGQQPEELKDYESNKYDGTTDDLMMITGFTKPLNKQLKALGQKA